MLCVVLSTAIATRRTLHRYEHDHQCRYMRARNDLTAEATLARLNQSQETAHSSYEITERAILYGGAFSNSPLALSSGATISIIRITAPIEAGRSKTDWCSLVPSYISLSLVDVTLLDKTDMLGVRLCPVQSRMPTGEWCAFATRSACTGASARRIMTISIV